MSVLLHAVPLAGVCRKERSSPVPQVRARPEEMRCVGSKRTPEMGRDMLLAASIVKFSGTKGDGGNRTVCCLSDAVRASAHVACGFAQWSSGKDSRAPGCPLSHDPKQLSMDLCVSSLALAASLTSQYWSNWSPGRLPDLGW